MAHEITSADAMISGRFITPWHGLGEIVGDFGIEDLRRIMGWKVEKFGMQTMSASEGGVDYAPMDTNVYATVRMPSNIDEKPIILGAGLSDGYSVLQNEQLIKVVEPFVTKGCALETAGTIRQGARVWIMLRLAGQIDVKGSDTIHRYIMVSNDHTGSQAAKIGLVGVRVVCQNTLNLAEQSKQSSLVRIFHTGDVNKNLETVSNMLNVVNGKFENYENDLNLLASKGVSEKDLRQYVRDCFFAHYSAKKASERAMRILKTEEKIIELFESGAGSDLKSAKGTVYGAYQAVNHYLNHNRDIALETRLSSIAWGSRASTDRLAFREAMKLAA